MVGPPSLSCGNRYPSQHPGSPETVMLPGDTAVRVAQEVRAADSAMAPRRDWCDTMWKSLIDFLPRGNTLSEDDWQRRHRLLQWVLLAHVPVLALIGTALHNPPLPLTIALVIPVLCAVGGRLLSHHRRVGSAVVSAGLVWCSTALVGITNGTIESHFHFFIIIGFIALYQDWVPFLLNVLFTVITHGVGSMWLRTLMFNHPAAQSDPWLWSLIHGVAVLLACIGVMLFWRVTEDEQSQKDDLTRKLADAEIGRRRFTSDMLVNLARRNQSMLYRQLEIINQLEESERNPDALAELFRLDHLTTRVRRNAENLLVLSGEKPPRVWSQPVPLRDVVRAAIAETEDLDRVAFEIPEGPFVDGASVTDLTHLLAELTENAVRFSPPDMAVTIRGRRDPRGGRGQLLTVEDWGVGMEDADLAAANALLAEPPEVDLSVSKRLGFHVVARLAARHGIRVVLSPTPGSGITASIALPGSLFELGPEPVGALVPAAGAAAVRPVPRRRPEPLAAAQRPTSAATPAAERDAFERAGSERAVAGRPAFDRATLERAAFDRAAFDRPAVGRSDTDRATTDRGSDRAEIVRAEADRTEVDPTDPDRARPDRESARAEFDRVDLEWAEVQRADSDRTRGARPDPDGAGPDRTDTDRGAADVRSLIPGPRMPLPEETTGLGSPDSMRGGRSWTGWWAGTDPTRGGVTGADPESDPATEAIASSGDPTTGADGSPEADAPPTPRPTLRRRVPQAHLAPGLRIAEPGGESADPAPLPVAAEALSRYQASRAAARSAVDGQLPHEAADERSAR
jgi:signal transduction histidine kinase